MSDQRQAVRSEPVERVAEGPLQVLVECGLGALTVVVGNRFMEDRGVARLLEVRRGGEDQPERVVVETGADCVVAALGERLVLVVGTAVRQLGRSEVEDPCSCPRGDQMHEAEEILVRVAEAHPSPDAGLEQRRRAREVEGDHALVLVPDVDGSIDVFARCGHLQSGKQSCPVVTQTLECRLDLGRVAVAVEQRPDPALVDELGAGRVELRIAWILGVAEHEDDLAGLAGLERELDPVRAAR